MQVRAGKEYMQSVKIFSQSSVVGYALAFTFVLLDPAADSSRMALVGLAGGGHVLG